MDRGIEFRWSTGAGNATTGFFGFSDTDGKFRFIPSATTVAGSTVFCQGGSVSISAPTATSYLWTPGGATTQSISATAGGTYTVQVSNGACSSTSPATVVTVIVCPKTFQL